jgi:hypothetical protein
MELTFDPYRWLPPPGLSGSGDAPGMTRPDWLVLAARLAAAHAFQRHALRAGRSGVMARRALDTAMREGSFHGATARVLAGFAPRGDAQSNGVAGMNSDGERPLSHVNPTSSADRKDTTGKVSTVAGPLPSGNRGLK